MTLLFLMDFPKKRDFMTCVNVVISLPLSGRCATSTSAASVASEDASYPRYFVVRVEHVARVTLNNFLSIRLSPMARDVKETRFLCGVSVPFASLIKGLIVRRVHEKPKEKNRQPAAVNYFIQDSPLLI